MGFTFCHLPGNFPFLCQEAVGEALRCSTWMIFLRNIFIFAPSSDLITIQEVSQKNVIAICVFISIPLGKMGLVYDGFKPGRDGFKPGREVSLSCR